MADWKYRLKTAPGLREAIHKGNCEEVLNQLEAAWKEIHERFPDDYEDPESDISDIENERDNLANHEDYGMTMEDVEENIDYLLNNLYDFCDNMKIWIEI